MSTIERESGADGRRVVSCRGVSKWYGEVRVLDAVDLTVDSGEIHVLLGENGAGKSTLVKIVAGLVAPDQGDVVIDGVAGHGTSVARSQAAGIALVHQEPRLFPDLTVHENMWIDEPARARGGSRRRTRLRDLVGRTSELLAELGCHASPDDRVADLSVADQQMVDVAAAIRRDLRVLVVDEPTASLTPNEVANLFTVLRRLRDRGVAIIFIGHRLDEVLAIGDRITVLRDGAIVSTLAAADADEATLVRLMVGRDIAPEASQLRSTSSPVALRVRDLSSAGAFDDVSFEVHVGEILGIGGLVGAGRTEVLETVFGLRTCSAGTVQITNGEFVASAADAIRSGMGLVPEDRGRHGLVLTRSIRENIVATNLVSTSTFGVRRQRGERELADRMMSELRVKAVDADQLPNELSGGNQQKVSLAKWMSADVRILLVDEPTRGVDIGSKAEIHALLIRLVEAGMAIVMVSSDMRELLELSDRIVVMCEGRVAGELAGSSATEECVLRLASGVAA